MQIPHPHPHIRQILRQVLRHPLRQRRHQHPIAPRHHLANLFQQVIHLTRNRTHLNHRVHKPRRANHLLDNHTPRLLELPLARRRRHINRLIQHRQPLFKLHRTIVERRRQPKPKINQRLLTRPVTLVHRPKLRHRNVALVYHHQKITRKIIQQRRRRLTRRPPRKMPRVVLNPVAIPHLLHHLEVKHRPLLYPLRLNELTL